MTDLTRPQLALCAAGVLVDVFAFSGSKRPSNYLRAWWHVPDGRATIGVYLDDVPFVLDDPAENPAFEEAFGLIQRLLAVLRRLKNAGNTVIVVEHDPTILEEPHDVTDEHGTATKAATNARPCSEATLSGWNWTPCAGAWACRTPIATPSSLHALAISGGAGAAIAREW